MRKDRQRHVFEKWMDQYKGLIFKFLKAYAISTEDQNDLFQEIALQVWKSIPGFKGNSSVSTWIYKIAMHTSITWSRIQKKHSTIKADLQESPDQVLKPATNSDERLDWLYEQIATFNEVDRAIVMLMLDGFSYKEMASLLGISETNVGVKINRIKKRLIDKSKDIKEQQSHGI